MSTIYSRSRLVNGDLGSVFKTLRPRPLEKRVLHGSSNGANVVLCNDDGSKVRMHEILVRRFTNILDAFDLTSIEELRDPFGSLVIILPGVKHETLQAASHLIYTGECQIASEEIMQALAQILASSVTAQLCGGSEIKTEMLDIKSEDNDTDVFDIQRAIETAETGICDFLGTSFEVGREYQPSITTKVPQPRVDNDEQNENHPSDSMAVPADPDANAFDIQRAIPIETEISDMRSSSEVGTECPFSITAKVPSNVSERDEGSFYDASQKDKASFTAKLPEKTAATVGKDAKITAQTEYGAVGTTKNKRPLPAIAELPQQKRQKMGDNNSAKEFAKVATPNVINKNRDNFAVRSFCGPKTFSQVLHHMAKGKECAFTFTSRFQHVTAECQFDGQVFVGTGRTQTLAKHRAAERAIQHIVTNKPDQMDEMNWQSLVSMSFHKLFNEWHDQGYQIPSELSKRKESKKFKCSKCEKYFSCKKNAIKHERTHTGE